MKMNSTVELEIGHIRMPNNATYLPALLCYAGRLCAVLGFSRTETDQIELSLEEVCLDVIQNAFTPDEQAHFDVTFLRRLDGVEIVVHDMGLPYDPTAQPVYDPACISETDNAEGLGRFLVNHCIDEYKFANLGTRGKEVRLIKYFKMLNIGENAKPVEPEIAKPPAEAPAERVHFNIRLMKPEEAMDVCRCIYDCYGYSYASEYVYYPERVVAMNRAGELRSVVAVTDSGEVGGHFALIVYEDLPAEIGIAVTKKKFRGQGFARQLGEELECEARKAGMKGLQVKEVTAHPYTQKFCQKLGYKDCGLLLGHSPKTLSFKGIADQLTQRNSDVLGFKYLSEPLPIIVHAPERHRDMIARLYDHIGGVIRFEDTESSLPPNEQTVMQVRVHALRALAEIFIFKYGADVLQAMRQELRKLFVEEIRVVELYLNLEDPVTRSMVPELEDMGFFFTGILPQTRVGDSMIMQYFHGVHIEYDQMIVVGDVALQLLEYVRQNDPAR